MIAWGTLAATLAAPFVFLLPGWMLLSLLLPPERFAPGRRPDVAAGLTLDAGLTLAPTPVALLFLYLTGPKAGGHHAGCPDHMAYHDSLTAKVNLVNLVAEAATGHRNESQGKI